MKPKRILAMLLSFALILSLVPGNIAFADEAQGENDIYGIVATDETSPLYTIEEVKAMIDSLPDVSELEDMDNDELSEVYEKAQDAYDAFEALTDEEQIELANDLVKLRDVLEYMTEQTKPLGADTGAHAPTREENYYGTVGDNYIFANGTAITIEEAQDGTVVWYMDGSTKKYVTNNDEKGEDLSDWYIFVGSDNVDGMRGVNGSVTMTGGKVKYIYAGQMRGYFTGTSNITITGGTVTNGIYCNARYLASVNDYVGTVTIFDAVGTTIATAGGTADNVVLKKGSTWSVSGNGVIPSSVTLTVGSGETLTVPTGATLTNNGSLVTNGGTITVYGKLTGNAPENYVAPSDFTFTTSDLKANVSSTLATPTVSPSNTTLVPWFTYELVDAGTTDAVLNGTTITPYGAGTVKVKVTMRDGYCTPIEKTYGISVSFTPVTGISGNVLSEYWVNREYTLPTAVTPSDASYSTVTWSVVDAGDTGAVINGNKIRATYGGTATIRATVKNGKAYGSDFVQDYTANFATTETIDISLGSVTISKKDDSTLTVTYAGFSGGSKDYSVDTPIVIVGDGTQTSNNILVQSGKPTVVLNNVNISATFPLRISGDSYVYLNLVGNNTLTGSASPGLGVENNATVVIDGPGSLKATGAISYGDAGCAGIGGYKARTGSFVCGTIIINGGDVTAVGAGGGAGIGGAYEQSFKRIEINGGTIKATGSTYYMWNYSSTSIGKGNDGTDGTIVFSGGTIIADPVGKSGFTVGSGVNNGENNGSQSVSLVTITLNGAGDGVLVTAVDNPAYYGVTDMKTRNGGKLYLYLPANTMPTSITAGGVEYLCRGGNTYYTQHTYSAECDATCDRCGKTRNNQAEHDYENGLCKYCKGCLPAIWNDSENYYEISNAGHLIWFSCLVNGTLTDGTTKNQSANAVLMNDIDMSGVTGYTPIGTTGLYYSAEGTDKGYSGTFDGNGCVIKNLAFTGSNSQELTYGIFGTLSGKVSRLGVENMNFTRGNSDCRAGGIVGQMITGSSVTNCYAVNSTISADGKVAGGLAGCNYAGTIENCYTYKVTVTASRAGGIVGDNRGDGGDNDRKGTIKNCYTNASDIQNSQRQGNVNNSTAGMSDTAFNGGEVTYRLNNGVTDGTQIWYQTLTGEEKQDYPSFSGKIVYGSNGQYVNAKIITITGVTTEDGTYNRLSHTGYTGKPTNADGYTGTYEVKYTGRNNTTYSSIEAPTDAGDYTVTISTDSNEAQYIGSVSLDFTISPKTVNNAAIDPIPNQTYTGSEIKPTITAYDGTDEIPTTEYEVVYSDNTDKGMATVELNNKANGNYIVSGSTTFEILPKSIDGATVSTFAEMTYSGDEQTPSATVTIDNLPATGTWSKVKNVNDTTTFTADGNFTGEISNQSTGMKPLPVEISWSGTDELKFDNTEKTISAEVSNKKGNDVVNITNISGDTKGTNRGTYTATVTAVDNENYTVTDGKNLTKVWSIAQTTDNEITEFSINGWTYGETASTPTATAKYGTATFTYSTEKDGSYTDTVPTNAGTYWVKATVAETDNYKEVSSEPISFTIAKANSETTVATDNATVTYGETLTLTATVGKSKAKAVDGDKVEFYLVEGESETLLGTADVVYADANKKDAGTATLIIYTKQKKLKIGDNTITAQYGGSVNLNGGKGDTITVTLKQKTVGLTWNDYENLVYDGNPKNVTAIATGIEADDGEIGVTVTGGTETNAGTHTATATELIGTNANYYKLPEEDTKTYTISPKTVTATISTISDQTYTGSAIKPTITAYDGADEIPTTEYDVVYSENTNKGTATVELKNKANGNYTVSGRTTFKILPKSINGATVSTFAEMTYNGDEQTPTATVTIGNLTATGVWSDVKYVSDTTTFTASGNFTGEISNQSTGMKKLSVIIEWKNTEGLKFDNTEKTISAKVSNKKGNDVVNITIDGDLTGTSKGTYTATVTAVDNENYTIENGQNLEKEWVISQANDNVITGLALAGWTYGDTANTPTANAKYGTPTFAYSEDENGGYVATVPTNAGTYWVKATVAGTEDYAEVSSDPISFTIAKAESLVTTEPTKAENLVYTGEELSLITADGIAIGGTIKYSVDGENFDYDFANIPKVINAKDDYKVWYKVVGDNNHNDTTAGCIEISVANKPINTAITLTAPVKNATPQLRIETDEYTATVLWSPEIAEGGTFAKSTEYTATITITPKTNYTVSGIGENGYTLDGATSVTNEAGSNNVVTAVFPRTGNSSSSSSRYTVKFNTNGGSTVTSQTVKKNTAATEPTEPTKDGYIFDGWYTDSKFANEYDFDTKVTKNITLYAKWVEDEAQNPSDDKKDDTNDKKDDNSDNTDDNKPTTDDWKNPFDDVKDNEWYFDNVRYANENGLMSGTTDTTFAPNDNLTRGMLVTVLYRAEGEPAVNKSIPFADVNASQYYANAVIWAEQNGIVKGVSETEFAPDENITREQIATIIYRYAEYKGIAPTGAWAIKLDYADVADISDYAVEGVMYCTMKNIMQGKDNNMFAPKDNATRAEIAAILNRFIESNK